MQGNMGNLFEQMQGNMRDMQEQLASLEIVGESGAGLVKVVMNAHHVVKRITIDPSLLADDKDMLEDLVAAAFNQAAANVQSAVQEKMGGLAGGLGNLGGMDLSSIFGGGK